MGKRDRLFKQVKALQKQGGYDPNDGRIRKLSTLQSNMITGNNLPKSEPKESLPTQPIVACNGHVFRIPSTMFDDYAKSDYPAYSSIPEDFKKHSNNFVSVVSSIFFKGGRLADHNIQIKAGVHRGAFYAVFRSMLQSFDPPHEHKTAACAWFLSDMTEQSPAEVAA